jgi:ferredoxin
MKVTADHDRCQGHAQCFANAPGLYLLDDDGYIAMDSQEVTPGDEDAARRGAAACPERAISVID